MDIEYVEKYDKEITKFIEDQEYSHIWQSGIWLKFRKEREVRSDAFIFREGGKIKATVQILYLPWRFGQTYAYISRGPIWDRTNLEVLKYVFDQLKKVASEKKCFFIRFDPPVLFNSQEKELLQSFGTEESPAEVLPPGTALVKLPSEKEKLLDIVSKRTRYSIRQAQKYKLEAVIANSAHDYNEYVSVQQSTEKRQGFHQKESQFFLSLLSLYKFNDPIFLLLVKHKGTALAGGIFVHFQKRLHYLAGGFDYKFQNLQGPSFLQLKAMELAIDLKCEYYDFFSYSPGHERKFKDIDKFKDGFKPRIVSWDRSTDIPVQNKKYFLYKIFTKLLHK